MNDTLHLPRWRQLLDGGRTWGSLDVSPSRYGVTRHRLAVFPPGISPDERMLLRLWRSFPIWGTLTWLTLEMVLVPVVGSSPALAISTVVCLGSGAVLVVRTSADRGRVRTLSVVRMAGFYDAHAADKYAELSDLANELAEADRRLAVGELSTVEHEAAVWRVYECLAPGERS